LFICCFHPLFIRISWINFPNRHKLEYVIDLIKSLPKHSPCPGIPGPSQAVPMWPPRLTSCSSYDTVCMGQQPLFLPEHTIASAFISVPFPALRMFLSSYPHTTYPSWSRPDVSASDILTDLPCLHTLPVHSHYSSKLTCLYLFWHTFHPPIRGL
jgi:hypothetical protein